MPTYQLLCVAREKVLAMDSINAANLTSALQAAEVCYPGQACQLWEGGLLVARTSDRPAETTDSPVQRMRWTVYID